MWNRAIELSKLDVRLRLVTHQNGNQLKFHDPMVMPGDRFMTVVIYDVTWRPTPRFPLKPRLRFQAARTREESSPTRGAALDGGIVSWFHKHNGEPNGEPKEEPQVSQVASLTLAATVPVVAASELNKFVSGRSDFRSEGLAGAMTRSALRMIRPVLGMTGGLI